MTIKFNSELLIRDFEATRKRRRITLNKASARTNVHLTTLSKMRDGTIKEITVNTLARILDFMEETDVSKYIYDDGA